MTLVYFHTSGISKRSQETVNLFSISYLFHFILIFSLTLWLKQIYPAGQSFLHGAFQSISAITTTGFYNKDYNLWGVSDTPHFSFL